MPLIRAVACFLINLCLLLAVVPVWAEQAHKPVLRGAYVEFPPLTYSNPSGDPSGAVIDRVEALANSAGYRVRWEGLPLGRVHLYLKTGKIDLWPGAMGIPYLQPWVLEADVLSGSIRLAAYHHPDQKPVDSIEDLRGKKLILLRNYTYLGVLDDVINADSTSINYAPNVRSAIQMLQHGRGEYLISFERPVDYSLANGIFPELVQSPIFERDIGLVFSSANLQAPKLVDQFQEAARNLPHSP